MHLEDTEAANLLLLMQRGLFAAPTESTAATTTATAITVTTTTAATATTSTVNSTTSVNATTAPAPAPPPVSHTLPVIPHLNIASSSTSIQIVHLESHFFRHAGNSHNFSGNAQVAANEEQLKEELKNGFYQFGEYLKLCTSFSKHHTESTSQILPNIIPSTSRSHTDNTPIVNIQMVSTAAQLGHKIATEPNYGNLPLSTNLQSTQKDSLN